MLPEGRTVYCLEGAALASESDDCRGVGCANCEGGAQKRELWWAAKKVGDGKDGKGMVVRDPIP